MNKSVKAVLPATEIDMGGFPVKQALPKQQFAQLDPFLLVHHGHGKYSNRRPAKQQGIGPHPHRGFSPVTFVIEGAVHHRDSRGNSQVAKQGEVQWMNAGAGIIHSERPSEEIADARDKGDLSENAEYHAAKEEQSLLETKIAKLKNVVASARIIDESQLDVSKILIHSIIKIKNTTNGMEFSYTLVADSESDIKNGKLSVNSPIGKGLLGKELGDVVEIKVPNGIMSFEVTAVSR